MRFDRLTEKASEAIIEAQNEAREYKHASIDPEHLLLALLRQQGGVVSAVIDRMGGDRDSLEAGLEQLLAAKSASAALRWNCEWGANWRRFWKKRKPSPLT